MRYLWIIVLTIVSVQAFSQDRVSASDVQSQKTFIEAHQKKMLGKIDEAIELFKDIRKRNTKLSAASYELAILYESQENYSEAIKMGKEAIELEPDNPWYQRALATIYEKDNQLEAAAGIYKKLAKKYPNEVEYHMMWAFYLVKAQNIKGAIKVYDDLEARRGIIEELSIRKYSLYLGIGDYKSAEKELQQLISTDTRNTKYLFLLAELYEQTDKKAAAKTQYEKILKIDPENGKARAALVEDVASVGSNAVQYANSLRPLIERENLDIDLKIGKLLPLVQQSIETNDKALTKALLNLTSTLESVHPNDAKAYSITGDLLFYDDQPEAAIQKYERTLELDDRVFTVWEQLMYAHLKLKQFGRLEKLAEEAIDLFPNKVKAYEMYGIAATKLGNTDDAIDLLNEALFMTGQNLNLKAQVYNALANAYWKADMQEQAKQSFEKGVEANAQSPKLLNDYSRFLADLNAFDQAFSTIQKAEKFAPNTPTISATRGYIHYKKKEYRKAKNEYEAAISDGGSNDSFILEGLGDVLYQLNETEAAIDYWKKALEKGDGSSVLKKKIEEKRVIE